MWNVLSMSQPLEPDLQRGEPRVLASNGQWLAVFFLILEQIPLIAFEGCPRNLVRRGGTTSSTPFQEHFHVNAANSQRAFAEALYSQML